MVLADPVKGCLTPQRILNHKLRTAGLFTWCHSWQWPILPYCLSNALLLAFSTYLWNQRLPIPIQNLQKMWHSILKWKRKPRIRTMSWSSNSQDSSCLHSWWVCGLGAQLECSEKLSGNTSVELCRSSWETVWDTCSEETKTQPPTRTRMGLGGEGRAISLMSAATWPRSQAERWRHWHRDNSLLLFPPGKRETIAREWPEEHVSWTSDECNWMGCRRKANSL